MLLSLKPSRAVTYSHFTEYTVFEESELFELTMSLFLSRVNSHISTDPVLLKIHHILFRAVD